MSSNKEVRRITAITFWWSEGTKKRRDKRWKDLWIYTVEVTNTDVRLMKVFLDFLREDIGIDESKLRAQIQIHEGDDQEVFEEMWSKALDIPYSNFNKTIVRPKGNKIGKNKLRCL